MRAPIRFVVAAGIAAVALGGCFGARSNPSQFYVLTSIAEAGAAEASGEPLDITVGLGPITMPDYLSRPQLVTRMGENEVAVSEYERWAGSFEQNLAESLGANLAVLLGTHDILAYPWYATASVKYAVSVGVVRFERTAQGGADLLAGWEIRDGASGERYDRGISRISEPVDTTATAASVAALSRALGRFSRELAGAIREVHARVGN